VEDVGQMVVDYTLKSAANLVIKSNDIADELLQKELRADWNKLFVDANQVVQ